MDNKNLPKEIQAWSHIVEEIHIKAPADGIYFLYFENELIYIGKTKNIINRIERHIDKQFDRIFFVPLKAEDKEISDIEHTLIEHFKPPQNYISPVKRLTISQAIELLLDKAQIDYKGKIKYKRL